jgi:hypothetical protein
MRRAVPRFIGVAVAATAVAVALTTAASAANTWTVQSVPFPKTAQRSANMVAVSCTRSTTCEAIINTDTAEPQVVKWNGTSWKPQPFPSGDEEYGTSISCASSKSCVAVGNGFADWWDGSIWRSMAGQGGDGVSCPSVRYCVTVGAQDVSGADQPYAAKWNGTAWKDLTVPPPTVAEGGGGELDSVSCTGITNCIAVGETSYDLGPVTPIAYRWNGKTWTQQTLPAPPAGETTPVLSGVSCSSARDCTAVGFDDRGGDVGNTLFADQWNGTAWTGQGPLPLPQGTVASLLAGVSCKASRCTAVGWSYPAKGASYKNRHALAEYFNGTGWAIQSTALPNAHQSLAAVSCVAIRTCTAVGFSVTKSTRPVELPLAEQD